MTEVVRAEVAGHFGELLQGRLGPDGPLVLVTLPAPPLTVRAWLRPGPGFALNCVGGQRPIAPADVARLAQALTGAPPRGRLTVAAAMPAGGGAGASTASLVAAAAALAAGPLPGPEHLAALCLALEGATDPLMYPAPGRLLWAPREARVIAALPPRPAFDVVGGFVGPPRRTAPADTRFADIADLVLAWTPAAACQDTATLAALATESARRNARLRGGPDPAPLVAAAGGLGALGVVAAHTGSARGFLFAPGRGDFRGAAAVLRAAGALGIVRFRADA